MKGSMVAAGRTVLLVLDDCLELEQGAVLQREDQVHEEGNPTMAILLELRHITLKAVWMKG